jgi:NADPH-dependent 2,4-dienoyl-CoA reductase/sulfur reductase-like enzyme
MATPDRVVVVGSSVGGVRTAQALRAAGFAGQLTVVGEEDCEPYDKPPLSKQALADDPSATDLGLLRPGGWDGEGIEPRLGVRAVALHPESKRLELADGEQLPYDALIVATGARPRTLAGSEPPLVHTIRTLRDAVSLRTQLLQGGPVVVVGSGFIGAEVAATARQLGLETTVVEAAPHPFARVLGPRVAQLVDDLHVGAGVRVVGDAGVERVETLPDGTAVVHLTDGRRLGAGAVVLGIGVLPNSEWLQSSGVRLDNGVVTDEHCRVAGVDGVYAVGDVANWYDVRSQQHRRVEHWTNAVEQASVVAHNVLHPQDPKMFDTTPYFWSDQHGVKIQMAGRIGPGDDVEVLRCGTAAGDRFVALYSSDGRFSAAVTFGWPRAVVGCRVAWHKCETLEEVRGRIDALSTSVRALSPS